MTVGLCECVSVHWLPGGQLLTVTGSSEWIAKVTVL